MARCYCAESDLLKMIAAALTDFPELNCYAALQLLLEVAYCSKYDQILQRWHNSKFDLNFIADALC